MSELKDDILIARYLEGGLNAQEHAELEMRRKDPDFEDVLNRSIRIARISGDYPVSGKWNSSKAWDTISARIERSDAVSTPRPMRFPKRSWIGIAAAVLILSGLWILQKSAEHYGDGGTISATTEAITTSLPDGSVVTLDRGARIDLPSEFGVRSRKMKAEGRIHFDVLPGEHAFVVHSKPFTIRVVGTGFTLDTRAEGSVDVDHGKVEVGYRNQIVRVEQGQHVELIKGALLSGKHTSDLWFDAVWNFEEVPLRTVVDQAERIFGIDIELPETYLSNAITLHMNTPGKEVVIRTISRLTGLQSRQEGNRVLFN
ncbi:MAG: FecR domain-containing protein [Flavobacteriales bacterium]|nr:FecR domain-containing protein [Flavobacteriales bacterium]